MRRRRALWVLAIALVVFALVLGPVQQPPRGASAYTSHLTPEQSRMTEAAPSQPMREVVLLDGGFSLGTAGDARTATFPLQVPARTASILVRFTFDAGAGKDFAFTGPSACQRALGPVVPGDGTRVAFDCGWSAGGSDELRVSHAAGHLVGRVEVVASVCPDRGPCPGYPTGYR